jgi:hypothetical protein
MESSNGNVSVCPAGEVFALPAEDDIFKMTPMAIDIKDTRSLRAAQMVRDALRNMGKIVANSNIAVLGAF